MVMCGWFCRRMSVSIEERGGERRAADFGKYSYRLQVIWRYSSKLNNIRSVALGLVSSDAHLVTYIPARARTHTQHTQHSHTHTHTHTHTLKEHACAHLHLSVYECICFMSVLMYTCCVLYNVRAFWCSCVVANFNKIAQV